MTGLSDLTVAAIPFPASAPWPRYRVSVETWQQAADSLAAGSVVLLSLWGERDRVHLALRDGAKVAVLSLDCPDGHFPSIGLRHPPAIRLERTIHDLYGHMPEGALDVRPWLDHGRWGVGQPLAAAPLPIRQPPSALAYRFLPVDGEGLHQIPVGPVHAGIIEPGHFRFTASGETVVRLEERLGYVHKGIDALTTGADITTAARLAGRLSGDSTVAYAFAFARAAEAAAGAVPSPRAVHLRALMAELERLANHLGDIGAICNDAAFALMHAHTSVLRERVLRFASRAFGHRLMMDRVVPGGVAADLDADAAKALSALLGDIRKSFLRLVELYDSTASLLDRTVGTGRLDPSLAQRFAPGGYIGRASGQPFDSRRDLAYPPYDMLDFEVPVRIDGDVNARVWIRIEEVKQSLSLIEQLATTLPKGSLLTDIGTHAGEGMAIVEGFRGPVLAWLRLGASGRVERCHLRDPSWFQWPLLEAVIEGNIVADFPLCNKSFNCSYSGHDL